MDKEIEQILHRLKRIAELQKEERDELDETYDIIFKLNNRITPERRIL